MNTPALQLLPYGQSEHEVIYSVGREPLNRMLIEAAARHPQHRAAASTRAASSVDPHGATLQLRDERSGRTRSESFELPLAADGAGSAVRAALVARGCSRVEEQALATTTRSCTIPATTRRAGRLCVRAARAAHLAARRLHADRAAQHRRQLHRHAVPAAPGRSRLRSPRPTARRCDAFFPQQFADAAARDARSGAAVCAASAGPARHRVLPRAGTRRAACCCSGTPRTRSCRSTARA